jgi:hypothetical protein
MQKVVGSNPIIRSSFSFFALSTLLLAADPTSHRARAELEMMRV